MYLRCLFNELSFDLLVLKRLFTMFWLLFDTERSYAVTSKRCEWDSWWKYWKKERWNPSGNILNVNNLFILMYLMPLNKSWWWWPACGMLVEKSRARDWATHINSSWTSKNGIVLFSLEMFSFSSFFYWVISLYVLMCSKTIYSKLVRRSTSQGSMSLKP